MSDNGSSYIATELGKWLNDKRMKHTRGAPYHPMTQGKIERWHQTIRNRLLLEHYYLPGGLEARIDAFVDDYNRRPDVSLLGQSRQRIFDSRFLSCLDVGAT